MPQQAAISDKVSDGPVEAQAPTLRRRVFRASAWVTGGYITRETLRLGSNLVLAQLLVPGDFGLMALVTIFLVALQMFSDIGVGPSIIQHKRGDEQRFLDTAWTIQVVRGVLLWLVCCAIAYPVSKVWGGALLVLLPVAGVNAIIQGFNSTRLFLLDRRIEMKRVMAIDIATQLIGVLVMIAWALWLSRSVWAMVAGGVAGSLTRMTLSHLIIPGNRHRFTIDRECFRAIYNFGRWIFISTIITFMAAQVSNLMYGALMPVAAMGIYWIGYQFANALPMLLQMFAGKIGFPALSDLFRRDEERFKERLGVLRRALILPSVGLFLIMILLGPAFIYLVYPTSYFGAGWIIQMFGVQGIAGVLNSTYGQAYLASAKTFRHTLAVAAQFVTLAGASLVGYFLGGQTGFLLGIGVSQLVKYPFDACLASRGGYWQRNFDLAVLVLSTGGCVLALWGAYPVLVLMGING